MPADTEVAGLNVVVNAEVAQAMKALEGMSKQFENTSLVAQQATDIQDASFTEVGKGMDNDLKQHTKHSEGVMAALKKIGVAWTAITAAAIGGVYGLLRASSYGSLYFGQWGAIMKDVANTAIRPLIPILNNMINEFKKLADILKQEGVWDTLKTGISDAITWFGDLDWKMQVLVATIGILLGATAIAGIIAILPTLGIAVGAIIAVLTGPVGLVLAIGAVILILGSWWAKTENGIKVIGDLKDAWQKFKDNVKDVGYIKAAWEALKEFVDWIFSPEQWVIEGSPLDKFLDFFRITIPDVLTNLIASALGWGSDFISNLVSGILSVISDLTDIISGADNSIVSIVTSGITGLIASALGWGSDFINNLVSGILSVISDLTDIISGTDNSIVSIITSGILGLIDLAWSWGYRLIVKLMKGIRYGLSFLGSVVGEVTGAITSGITGVVDSATGWGGNLIDNLVSGINAGMPSLSDAVSAITDTLSGIGGSGGTGTGGTGGTGTGGYWAPNSDLTNAQKSALSEQYMNGGLTSQEYYEATHTWVEGTGGTPGGETPPAEVPSIPRETITGLYKWHHHQHNGWSIEWINQSGEPENYTIIGTLIDAIGGTHVLQSVFDALTEPQQQNFMDSHGAIIDDTTHELTQQYATGGYVPYDMNADIHRGEYVVPRGGTLVHEGGMPDITINLTVNNGTQKDSRALADEISRLLSTEIRRLVKT